MNWQKGTHGLRYGFEVEHAPGTGFWDYCDPGCLAVAPPELVRANVPPALLGALFPTLPSQVRTAQDILNLPFLGGVVGIGDPSQPPPYNVDKANRYRLFFQDSWRVRPRLTLNYGLAWNHESTLVNRDLNKPKYLAPLYGSDLTPTNNNPRNFSPAVGLRLDSRQERQDCDAWWLWDLLRHGVVVSPSAGARLHWARRQWPHSIPCQRFRNTLPGIVDISRGGAPVPIGAPVAANDLTNMTLAQFLQIQQAQVGPIAAYEAVNRYRLEKRLSSFNSMADQHGYNGLYNMDNWASSWGPQAARHILNISGIVEMTWGFQLGVISSMSSRGPITAQVTGVDLTGSGITNTALPGIPINGLNRGYGKADLQKAVDNWNANIAGKPDALGKIVPKAVLSSDYELGRPFYSQDVRLSKKFTYRERYVLSAFVEGFNVFNIANLGGYSFNVDQVQPTSRGAGVWKRRPPRFSVRGTVSVLTGVCRLKRRSLTPRDSSSARRNAYR